MKKPSSTWTAIPIVVRRRATSAATFARSRPSHHPTIRPSLPLSQGGGSRTRRKSGDAEFRRLATKYLVVHGGFDAPTEPPTSPFLGDGIVVTVGPDPTPTPPQREGVRFSASGPNSEGVLTELLVQRLSARHRLPKGRDYRSKGFIAFAGEGVDVPLRRGAYACAFRFVRASTGQATAMVPLGTVEVG